MLRNAYMYEHSQRAERKVPADSHVSLFVCLPASFGLRELSVSTQSTVIFVAYTLHRYLT